SRPARPAIGRGFPRLRPYERASRRATDIIGDYPGLDRRSPEWLLRLRQAGAALALAGGIFFFPFCPERLAAEGGEIVSLEQKSDGAFCFEDVAVPNAAANDLSGLIGENNIYLLPRYLSEDVSLPSLSEGVAGPLVDAPSGERIQFRAIANSRRHGSD